MGMCVKVVIVYFVHTSFLGSRFSATTKAMHRSAESQSDCGLQDPEGSGQKRI